MVDDPLDAIASAILVVMMRARDCEAKIALIAAHASPNLHAPGWRRVDHPPWLLALAVGTPPAPQHLAQ
jgi:hypothetical protein